MFQSFKDSTQTTAATYTVDGAAKHSASVVLGKYYLHAMITDAAQGRTKVARVVTVTYRESELQGLSLGARYKSPVSETKSTLCFPQ
jgi:uncharacterized protein with PhoU and TrkA domain